MSDKSLIYIDKALTAIGAVAFVVLLPLAFLQSAMLCLRIAVVCGVSFLVVTLLRKKLNLPRPKLEGAVYSGKTGEAFPSRHTFSMAIIGLSWLNVNVIVGAVIFGLSFVLGGVRIAMGAHSTRDVYGAIVIAVTFACAGYLIF